MQLGLCLETGGPPKNRSPTMESGQGPALEKSSHEPSGVSDGALVLKGEEATRQGAEDSWLQRCYVPDHPTSTANCEDGRQRHLAYCSLR